MLVEFLLLIKYKQTEPWWLSGLERQSNSSPMLKVEGSNQGVSRLRFRIYVLFRKRERSYKNKLALSGIDSKHVEVEMKISNFILKVDRC